MESNGVDRFVGAVRDKLILCDVPESHHKCHNKARQCHPE